MPSIAMSDSLSSETLKTLKKDKKMKIDDDEQTLEISGKKKSSKKEKKSSKDDSEKKKEKKKRKAIDLDDSDKSETSSELGDPINLKGKKAKLMDVDDDDDEEEEANPNALSNFKISKQLQIALVSKGIKALFPIQAMTFNDVFNGCDLVGRARTGQVGGFFVLSFFPDFVVFCFF